VHTATHARVGGRAEVGVGDTQQNGYIGLGVNPDATAADRILTYQLYLDKNPIHVYVN